MRRVLIIILSLLSMLVAGSIGLAAAPQAGAIDTTWITVIARGDADLDRYFEGPVYRTPIGDLQRLAGFARTETLPLLKNNPGVIGALTADDVPLPPNL